MWSVHPRIGKLLLQRFLLATCKCYQLQFQLLMLFLLFTRFDVADPINFNKLFDVFYWSTINFFTWFRMLPMMVIAGSYGMILCLMHQQPNCDSWWQPLKLCLATAQIILSYCSSWLYLSYYEVQLVINEDMNRYLKMSAISTGLYHFLVEYFISSHDIWPLPKDQQQEYSILAHWMEWPNIWLAFHKSLLPTLVIAAHFSPDWQLLSLACCISTLITSQLLEIKLNYGKVMLKKLPLTLREVMGVQNQENEISLILAIRTSCLHGFQLQVAKNFYEIMSDTQNDECSHLFQYRHKNRWQLVYTIILGRIAYFKRRLEHFRAMESLASQVLNKPRHSHINMRPLMSKQPKRPPVVGKNNLNKEISRKLVECELSNGTSFLWLIPGLICICERSLKEDTYGILQGDLDRIFGALIDFERFLRSLKVSKKYTSVYLDQLLSETSRSINKLKCHFKCYLDYVIKNADLLNVIQNRPAN